MPSYIVCIDSETTDRAYTNISQVSLKDGAPSSELDKAKKQVEEQGGKVTKELKLIKGFSYVSLPAKQTDLDTLTRNTL